MTTIYAGTAGVVLGLLDAYAATGDVSLRDEARAGADALAARIPTEKDMGFYEGLAGTCFTLGRVVEVVPEPGERKRRQGEVRACLARLQGAARRIGAGVEWNADADVMGGSAGIGLYLLHAAAQQHDPSLRDTAAAAGRRLLEIAIDEGGGKKWFMNAEHGKLMPGFTHGTAGIAYFLGRLHQETHEPTFLDAALAGGRYLMNVAEKTGPNACLVFHSEPARKPAKPVPFYRDVHYLGFCHGPSGTGRLFKLLGDITHDAIWFDFMKKQAGTVMALGVPERRTPGFWQNVGACCGNAGLGNHFLDLHRALGDPRYLAFARKLGDDLIRRATRDEAGSRWTTIEARIKPGEQSVQTGWMQGAAGIVSFLYRLDAALAGKDVRSAFPDNPF